MRNHIGDGGSTDERPVTFEEMQIGAKKTGGKLVIVHQVVILHVQVLVGEQEPERRIVQEGEIVQKRFIMQEKSSWEGSTCKEEKVELVRLTARVAFLR